MERIIARPCTAPMHTSPLLMVSSPVSRAMLRDINRYNSENQNNTGGTARPRRPRTLYAEAKKAPEMPERNTATRENMSETITPPTDRKVHKFPRFAH